jgi:hypothetical protein
MNELNWWGAALDQLADIYVSAPAHLREELVREVDTVNQLLASNALFEGESRGGYGRVKFAELLVVFYTVVPNEAVQVVQVRPNKPLRK